MHRTSIRRWEWKYLSGGRLLIVLVAIGLMMLLPLVVRVGGLPESIAPMGMHPSSVSLDRATPLPNIPAAVYDEQLGITFTQSFASLATNVTAVAQTDSLGYGPAYLLNGLTGAGYWYQVGISYDWPYVLDNGSGGYSPGFSMNYETFNPAGNSIFPSGGGGGNANFTAPINSGDTVLLSLSFSGGNVVMVAKDFETGTSASVSFGAQGASSFVGSTSGPSNSNGFFTGLMTEWYHAGQYFGGEQKVVFTQPSAPLSSAWMWIDEFNSDTNRVQFSDSTQSPVSFADPNEFQTLSSNGATVSSDAYEFLTGTLAEISDSLTFSYSVVGGGVGYSAPTLTLVSGGVQQSAPLTATPTARSADAGTQWTVTGALEGSGPFERWQTDQQTNGTVIGSQTIVFVYYHQFQVGFEFTVTGGSGAYSAPTVSYGSFGVAQLAPTGSPQVWVDAGANYQYTNPLIGSSSMERWSAATPTGSVGSAQTITVAYYHQAEVSATVAIVGDSPPYPPEMNGTSYGTAWTTKLAPGPSTSAWLDVGSSYALQNPLPGSSGGERWFTGGSVSGPVSPGLNLSATYYQQYDLNISFAVVGGGSGYAPPNASYTSFSSAGTAALTTRQAAFWLDAGSQLRVSTSLPGSTSNERWQEGTGPAGSLTVVQASAVVVDYYHQYLETFGFSVVGGGSGYSAPPVDCTQLGANHSVDADGSPVWVDAGAEYQYAAATPGSNQTERWEVAAASDADGTLATASEITATYYHQYLVSISYAIVGGGSPSAPVVSGTQFGRPLSERLTPASVNSLWLDAGSTYSMPQLLTPSGSSERWSTNSTLAGPVLAASSNSLEYQHQYYVALEPSPATGGSLSPPSGWYDAETGIQVVASPSPGWTFQTWSGGDDDFSSSGSVQFTVGLPVNETAVFYPGLDIVAGSHASVTYSDGTITGSVAPGKASVIYVPPGSLVTLAASPAPFPYAFGGWTGLSPSANPVVTLEVDQPQTIAAGSAFSYVGIGVIAIVIVAAAFGAVLLWRRRSRGPASWKEKTV